MVASLNVNPQTILVVIGFKITPKPVIVNDLDVNAVATKTKVSAAFSKIYKNSIFFIFGFRFLLCFSLI